LDMFIVQYNHFVLYPQFISLSNSYDIRYIFNYVILYEL
jgi:hypothetical protein